HAERGALFRRLRRLAPGRAAQRARPRPVVRPGSGRRYGIPQGHRWAMGRAPSADQAHPGGWELSPGCGIRSCMDSESSARALAAVNDLLELLGLAQGAAERLEHEVHGSPYEM